MTTQGDFVKYNRLKRRLEKDVDATMNKERFAELSALYRRCFPTKGLRTSCTGHGPDSSRSSFSPRQAVPHHPRPLTSTTCPTSTAGSPRAA